MARYPRYLETPLSVEPRDSCLHQPYAFVRCMRVANGVNERLAVAYEKGLVPVFICFEPRDGFLHYSLLRVAAVKDEDGLRVTDLSSQADLFAETFYHDL